MSIVFEGHCVQVTLKNGRKYEIDLKSLNGYKPTNNILGGVKSIVSEVLDVEGHSYALKMIFLKDSLTKSRFEGERKMSEKMSELDIGPKFHDSWIGICSHDEFNGQMGAPSLISVGFILMEKMDYTLSNIINGKLFSKALLEPIVDELKLLLNKLRSNGLSHDDLMSCCNVVLNIEKRKKITLVRLIDFENMRDQPNDNDEVFLNDIRGEIANRYKD
jgi:hypothetical protein